MAIALSKVSALPDILNSNRHNVIFGPLPGDAEGGSAAGSSGVGGEGLSLKMVDVQIPGLQIGQIRIPVLGYPIAFAGGFIDHQNKFSMSFYEDSKGQTIKALMAWFRYVIGFGDRNGHLKKEYAIDVRIECLDTTGKVAYAFLAEVVWPTNIVPSPGGEEGVPSRHQVEFSMDFLDIDESMDGSEGETYEHEPEDTGEESVSGS